MFSLNQLVLTSLSGTPVHYTKTHDTKYSTIISDRL